MSHKHCCKDMNFFLEENKVVISYTSNQRLYAINLKSSGGLQAINYCPWCGSKLPSFFKNEWFDTLEELGFEDPYDQEIPEEFKTDEWWKKRGL